MIGFAINVVGKTPLTEGSLLKTVILWYWVLRFTNDYYGEMM